MRTVVCSTSGCENEGVAIEVPDAPPEGDLVQCGPCGAILDASLDLDDAQRDELRTLSGRPLPGDEP